MVTTTRSGQMDENCQQFRERHYEPQKMTADSFIPTF